MLLEALPQALQGSSAAQVAVLGTGKADLEAKVEAVNSLFPGRAAGVVEFNGPLAHLMTAGALPGLNPCPRSHTSPHREGLSRKVVAASTWALIPFVDDLLVVH